MKNKILTVLLSVIVAFGLWFYVISVVNTEKEETFYNIPVVLQGETILNERGLMLTSEKTPTVNLRLGGNRTDLNKLNSANITLIADLTKIYEAGEQKLTYNISFPGNVPNNAVQVLNKNPDRISVVVEEQKIKNVPVKISYIGSVPENYLLDREHAQLDYKNVMVTGPAAVIEKIDHAKIEVDLNGRNSSFSEAFRYTLCDAAGEPVDVQQVVTNVGEVNLTLLIQRVKEIKLKAVVIDGGGATVGTSDISITPETIQVAGSEALLESLTDEWEICTINLGELETDYSSRYPISLPAGVTNLTGVTEAIVSVRFPDLKTREFEVKNIEARNVPEGMAAEFITTMLTVKVRGPKEIMEKMTGDEITVYVDFQDMQAGTATLKAEIIISVRGVGPVGSYPVSATLREAEPEPQEE